VGKSIGLGLYGKYSAAEATTALSNGDLTVEELGQYGFFRKFSHYENEESGYSYLYRPVSEPVTLWLDNHQWDILASAIPAMSFAGAANSLDVLPSTRNINMEALRGGNQEWPSSRITSTWQKRWLHNDIRNVALPYVCHTFDKMLDLGGFR
jgi:hypothetical protein